MKIQFFYIQIFQKIWIQNTNTICVRKKYQILFRYKNVTFYKRTYVCYVCLLAGIGPTYINYTAYFEIKKTPDLRFTCYLPTGFRNSASPLFSYANNYLSIATIVVYAIIWITIKWKKLNQNKQILRSITVMTLCAVSGWAITAMVMTLLLKLNLMSKITTYLFFIGMFVNISIASNFPIYFWMR